ADFQVWAGRTSEPGVADTGCRVRCCLGHAVLIGWPEPGEVVVVDHVGVVPGPRHLLLTIGHHDHWGLFVAEVLGHIRVSGAVFAQVNHPVRNLVVAEQVNGSGAVHTGWGDVDGDAGGSGGDTFLNRGHGVVSFSRWF